MTAMRFAAVLVSLLVLAGCPADPIEWPMDAMPDAPAELACRYCGVGAECSQLGAQCRGLYGPRVHAFVCDPGAPIAGPGYQDCYVSGGPDGRDLMCCTDPVE